MVTKEPSFKKPQSSWCKFWLLWTLSFYWIIFFITYLCTEDGQSINDYIEIYFITMLISTMFFIFISVIVGAVKLWKQKWKEKTYLEVLKIHNEAIVRKAKITDFHKHYSWWENSEFDWFVIVVNDWKDKYWKIIRDYWAETKWCKLSKYNDMKDLWIEPSTDKEILKKRAYEKLSEINNKLNSWLNFFNKRKYNRKLNKIHDIINNIDEYTETPAIYAQWETYTIWDEVTINIDPTDKGNYEIVLNDNKYKRENPEVNDKIMEKYEKDLHESVFHEIFSAIYKTIIGIIVVIIIIYVLGTLSELTAPKMDSKYEEIMNRYK